VKVLVTGGAGFIGHHIVRSLLDQGHSVTVLDDLSTGSADRLAPLQGDIRFLRGDIRDPLAVDEAAAGNEVVLHQAALPSVARSIADPRTTDDVNAGGTIEVLLGAARAGVRRVVFAASSSVYGDSPDLPRRESQPTRPLSPYAVSKVAAEQYVHVLGRLHGVETVALRYFNIFGPGQDPASQYAAVIPRFIIAGLEGRRPVIFGDGRQSRDFTYVGNAVDANLRAMAAPLPEDATFNIGCGTQYTLLELVDAIGRVLGRDLDPVFSDPRPGDVPHSRADITEATRHLGYGVTVPFDEGIGRTVRWYQERIHD
jgi:UDP-glucose 4-epimerase